MLRNLCINTVPTEQFINVEKLNPVEIRKEITNENYQSLDKHKAHTHEDFIFSVLLS